MKKILRTASALLSLLFVCGCTGGGEEATMDKQSQADTYPAAQESDTAGAVDTIPAEVLSAPLADSFKVSRVFDDDMVIQRNEHIRIWGWADEEQNGKSVFAEFGGLTGGTVIKDGEWLITLGGTLPENTEGQTLRVYGDGHEKTYDNVLIGDVYWIVGQSNIHYFVDAVKAEPLASEAGRNVEISNDDLIRLNRNASTDSSGLKWGTAEVNENVAQRRGWEKPKRGAPAFSAIGYFFGKQIYDATGGKIPIGLIEFDGDGCALNAFCPNEVCDALKIDTLKDGVYTAMSVNNHPTRFIYNHYMYAFQKFPICGIVWYQGESDMHTQNAVKFAERFTYLINEYRSRHDLINHDYPVFAVEFPSIYINFDYAQVRTYFGQVPTMLKNCYLAASSDLWLDKTYWNNLHPYIKWEQALRLSSLALSVIYGVGSVDDTAGPQMTDVVYSADKRTATVSFAYTGGGLSAEGGALRGFEVRNGSRWNTPESAFIDGDTVVLTSAGEISAVRYHGVASYSFPAEVNLCSGTGIPAIAFIK